MNAHILDLMKSPTPEQGLNVNSPVRSSGTKAANRSQPRMGLITKATELNQMSEIESKLIAPVCSTPSGVANLVNR